jgi:peptide/nickel transport system substrate-binding protein
MDPSGVPAFGRMVERYIYQIYILQAAWLNTVGERNGWDTAAISSDVGEDIVSSGPFVPFFDDDYRIVLIRNENYWGQDASMWGALPAPRFLVNQRFADNAAGFAAMQAGEIDMSQFYMANVHLLWEQHGLPISTYYDGPPYHFSADIPTVWFNLREGAHPALQHVELRRAIAYSVDYDAVAANAMTNQTPLFRDFPRSLMAANPVERAFLDVNRIRDLAWVGNDIEGANELLDSTGLFPMGDDGYRTYNGEKLAFRVSCPFGWSDWEAALEMVAAGGQAIGIDITTYFPQESEFYDHVTVDPTSTEFDIFMMWTGGFSHTNPWGRIRNVLSSEWIEVTAHNWSGNWGHYSNPRIDEIIKLIPITQDHATLVDLYTEAMEIYLTDVPSFAVMYRPDAFHTVYEGVWTGWTEAGDGRNVPPMNALGGYAIRDLYDIRTVG